MCRQVCHFSPAKLILVEQAENPLFDIENELRASHAEIPATGRDLRHIRPPARHGDMGGPPPGGGHTRSGPQARPADGEEPVRGHQEQRAGHAQRGRRILRARGGRVRHDLDRQGRQPVIGHGHFQARRGDVHAGDEQPRQLQDSVQSRPIRQRAGLVRLGRSDVPQADRRRRPGDRDAPGDDALLHDYPRGRPARAAGPRPQAAADRYSCSIWASRSRSSTLPGT